jgi:hypothetical protein
MPRKAQTKPQKTPPPDTKGKRIEFDIETWQALDVLARERMMTFPELADEAFRDVLRKYGRPYDVRDALKKSARAADTAKAPSKQYKTPNSKRPTGGVTRRARS